MKARELQAHRQALEELRRKALEAPAARIEPSRRDETQAEVVDEDAQALTEMLQVLGSQRNRGQAAALAKIDKALRKLTLHPEEFGLCEECEEEIARPRLKLLPHAELCLECQQKRDPSRGGRRRKVTDAF